jgi:serine protease AprX
MEVAAVAEDPQITRIDCPRRLRRELIVAAQTMRVPGFRHETGLTGLGESLALLDGEAAARHPALAGRIIQKAHFNFTKEPWGSPDAHATAVAGAVGAHGSSILGSRQK